MGQLFETCGVLASFLATFIEGEMLFVTAMISAKLGYFSFAWGVVAAFFGAFSRDFMLFFLARKKGSKILERKPSLKNKIEKASMWFGKHPFFYMTIYRLTYSFSTVIVILSGLKNVSFLRFTIHSLISVALWTAILGMLGYYCAEFVIEKLNFISDNKFIIISVLAVAGIAYWFFFKRHHDKECFLENKERITNGTQTL